MARIKLDLDRTVGEVDRRIFGGFIEHLGRCIYGGVFEPGSTLADERGYRRDVIEAVRPLGVPVLRWPGGNFVSGSTPSSAERHPPGPLGRKADACATDQAPSTPLLDCASRGAPC